MALSNPRHLHRKKKGRTIRGTTTRHTDTKTYNVEQIRAVLAAIGINVDYETYSAFVCYCPFHDNSHDAAFAVNRETGLYICFNPACADDNGNPTQGTLEMLVSRLTGRNPYETQRFINKKGSEAAPKVADQLEAAFRENQELPEFPQSILDRLYKDMPGSPGEQYMFDRGFVSDTVEFFKVGYSEKQRMVTVPVHGVDGRPVGMVGRGIDEKKFKNSKNLPRNQTLFNIHRAKRQGDTVIVTEASFDAMRLHQSGYPNGVAVLGGNMSPTNLYLLERHFNKIIIATDFDELIYFNKNGQRCGKCRPEPCKGHNPGRDLGRVIANAMRNKLVYWASYDPYIVYPNGAKDLGDLTDEQIKQVVTNAVPDYEYRSWSLDGQGW